MPLRLKTLGRAAETTRLVYTTGVISHCHRGGNTCQATDCMFKRPGTPSLLTVYPGMTDLIVCVLLDGYTTFIKMKLIFIYVRNNEVIGVRLQTPVTFGIFLQIQTFHNF
jgi:hypothetical protein